MLAVMPNWGSLLRRAVDAGIRALSPTGSSRPTSAADRPRGGAERSRTGSQARTAPTTQRARAIVYAPDIDGAADPGEIVWAWVPFEEDDGRGKDRPLLVVGRGGGDLLGLMLSSQHRRDGDPDWVSIGSGGWDRDGRESFVRLDRVLEIAEHGIRREGAVLDRGRFERVAARLREQHGWT